MKTVTIAFDVDGTLIDNRQREPVANERVRSLLVALSSFKNVKILVWSGGGELYARQAAAAIGIQKYVDGYADKEYMGCKEHTGNQVAMGECNHHVFATELRPDIAVDDIQDCELGLINLIVREK